MNRKADSNRTMALVTSALLFAACGAETESDPDRPYNVLMISINNIGAEHMSLYGYERLTTPGLDAWAEDALVFDNFFSHSSWTLPVGTSLFTSLHPYAHRVMDRWHGNLLDPTILTLPRILLGNGYRTAAFTGGVDYKSIFGHMDGFEVTDNNPDFTGFEVTLRQAGRWLLGVGDDPFFLFIHGYDTHCPFDPPDEYQGLFSDPEGKNITVDHTVCMRGYGNAEIGFTAYVTLGDPFRTKRKEPPKWFKRKLADGFREHGVDPATLSAQTALRDSIVDTILKVDLTADDISYLSDLYDEEVLHVDAMVSEFLADLDDDLLDRTVIILLSEHGEMFAKHGRFGRAGTTRGTHYDDVLHVPLMMKWPGSEGGRVSGLAQFVDVMPTVLDLLDIAVWQDHQGKSLLPLVEEGRPLNDYAFAGALYNVGVAKTNRFFPDRSVNESLRSHKWKLIREARIEHQIGEDGYTIEEELYELYDIENDPDELINVADAHPEVLEELKAELSQAAARAKSTAGAESGTMPVPEDLIEEAMKRGYW